MKRMALAVVVILGAATTASAQQPVPPAPSAPARAPRIAVDPAVFDFGKALQEKTLEKEFTLRNLGNADLVIESVSTTCGCTVADGYAKVVKPGGTTPLRVQLQTRNNVGRISRSVLVKTNDPSGRPLELKVEATVERPSPAS